LTDHQFRETLEVTDRTYVIREGRVFAYGDREAIINNADVRRYYIGERFDVGHLLDKRHRHELPGTQTPAGSPVDQVTGDVMIDDVDSTEDEDGDDGILV
jgi:lipopolysaccharide export system ATP-binding protein